MAAAQETPEPEANTSISPVRVEAEVLKEAAYEFARAKLLSDTGQFEEALASFEKAIELDGGDPYSLIEVSEFHAYLAQISRTQRKQASHLEASARYATRAKELAPDNVDVLRSYAQGQMRLVEQHQVDALSRAREAFEQLRGQTEGDLHVLISLGQIYLWQQEAAKAADVLTEASSFYPNHPTIDGLLVDALLNSGDLEEAETVLGRVVGRDPTALEQRLQLAELRSHRGDHRGALEILRAGPETQFVNPKLRRLMARELHFSGENEEALAVTDTLLDESAPGLSVRRLRVSIFSALMRYEEAISELEPLLAPGEDAEQNLQDELFLSRLLERIGRPEEAAGKLRGLLEKSDQPQSLRVKMALVSLLERQDMADEAVELLTAEFEKATPETLTSLGRVLVQLLVRNDLHDRALEVVDRLIAQPEIGELADRLRLQKTTILGDRGAWDEALKAARALGSTTDSREVEIAAHLRVAEALVELDETEDALAGLARAEKKLDAAELLAQRLQILFDVGREEEAQALLTGRTSSGSPEDLLFVVQVYQRAERYEDALPILERLLGEDPESLQLQFFRAAAFERSGRHEQAVAAFRDLLDSSPDHAPSLNYLGYMWAERGENLDEALTLIQRAVAIDPDNGAYVDSLGWVYFQLERYDEARQHLEWAARLVPDDPTILEHLGDIYMRLQDLERARHSYQQALDLGAGDSLDEVRRKLKTLEQKGL